MVWGWYGGVSEGLGNCSVRVSVRLYWSEGIKKEKKKKKRKIAEGVWRFFFFKYMCVYKR